MAEEASAGSVEGLHHDFGGARDLGGADTRSWIKRHSPKDRRVLVFVHGFNNRYEESVYRFAQIVHDSGTDVVPVVFTWPSRASIFDYNYDKESTNYSRDALEEMLTRLAKDSSVSDITVMAHSMGTWLAVEALRQMAIRNGHVLPKINNVILAAPDLDVDVFGRQYASLGKDKPKFTLFVSQDDRALSLSRRISGNVDRLGQIDPGGRTLSQRVGKGRHYGPRSDQAAIGRSPQPRQVCRKPRGREADRRPVDCRPDGDRLRCRSCEAIGAVGIGAAQTVGTAASVAISAPIAVFDPRTRENYGRQVERLGRSVENTVGSVGDTATSVVDPQLSR